MSSKPGQLHIKLKRHAAEPEGPGAGWDAALPHLHAAINELEAAFNLHEIEPLAVDAETIEANGLMSWPMMFDTAAQCLSRAMRESQ